VRSHNQVGTDQPDATRLSRVAATPKATRSLVRPSVIIPAVLAILLVVAIGFAMLELNRADDEKAAPPAGTTSATSRVTHCLRPLSLANHDDANHEGRCCTRRGDRRRLLAARQHRHDRQRSDHLLLDAAEHQREHLVADPGHRGQPHGHHRADRPTIAHRRGVAGAGVHAADRPDASQCREDIRRSNGLP